MSLKKIRLGTRKSALALAQAQWVTEQLQKAFPKLEVERVMIVTRGDQLTSPSPQPSPTGRGSIKQFPPPVGGGSLRPFPLPVGEGVAAAKQGEGEGGLKALFTKEIEEALLDERIDLAVHSLKDMSAELPQGLILAAIPEREDPSDVWIARERIPFKQLLKGARIGTGAVRRQAQIRHARPDLELVPLRGNVDTRLRKLEEMNLDGIILALAGLRRLGRQTAATEILPLETMLPAVGQGCLGIEWRAGDKTMNDVLKVLDHPPSHQAALAERAFLKHLGGTCQTPIAGYAHVDRREIRMTGLVISPDGKVALRDQESGGSHDSESVGRRLAEKLLAAGADKILQLEPAVLRADDKKKENP